MTQKFISEVLAEMNATKKDDLKLVRDWKSMIPQDSQWFPGCPGDPFCKECDGRGYLRMDLPIGHPHFGKIFLCDCVRGRVEKLPNVYEPDDPFMDDPYEQAKQQAFDTGEPYQSRNKRRGAVR